MLGGKHSFSPFIFNEAPRGTAAAVVALCWKRQSPHTSFFFCFYLDSILESSVWNLDPFIFIAVRISPAAANHDSWQSDTTVNTASYASQRHTRRSADANGTARHRTGPVTVSRGDLLSHNPVGFWYSMGGNLVRVSDKNTCEAQYIELEVPVLLYSISALMELTCIKNKNYTRTKKKISENSYPC